MVNKYHRKENINGKKLHPVKDFPEEAAAKKKALGSGQLKQRSFKKGGHVNTRRENRLEELGRVDAEHAYTKKGKRNLKAEKKRIVREVSSRGAAKRGHGKEIK